MIKKVVFETNNDESRFTSMLSLCKRAGKLVSGEASCEAAIKSKKAKLVFLSDEASNNTTKKFLNSSAYYKVPVFVLSFTKEQMGNVIGEAQRSVITVIGGDFAEILLRKLGDKGFDVEPF